MKIKKKWLSICLVICLIGGIGGAAWYRQRKLEERRISLVYIPKVVDSTNDFWKALILGTKMAAKEYNADIEIKAPNEENDIEREKQAKQYEVMTETKIPRLILRLSVPTVLSMLITGIYNLADTYFVGQLNNTSASGAIGVVASLMAIIQALGLCSGTERGATSVAVSAIGTRTRRRGTHRRASSLPCFSAGS